MTSISWNDTVNNIIQGLNSILVLVNVDWDERSEDLLVKDFVWSGGRLHDRRLDVITDTEIVNEMMN